MPAREEAGERLVVDGLDRLAEGGEAGAAEAAKDVGLAPFALCAARSKLSAHEAAVELETAELRIRTLGGRTFHWNAVCLRFSADDFRERSLHGVEEDWPLSYEEIAPFYSHVERQMHVFGTRERILVDCQLTGGAPSGGNCSGTSYRSPSYSRDGGRMVLDAGERIGVMAADGSGLSLLPPVTADDGNPVFAPDGRRIVFTGANVRGTTDFYVRGLVGGAAQLIVNKFERSRRAL